MKPGTVLFRTATTAMLGTALAIVAAFGLFSTHFTGIAAAQTTGASKAKVETYYLMVLRNPVAGKEDEYNKYSEMHQLDVVSVPGFMTAQRFVLSNVQLRQSKPLPKYMEMYKIVTDDLPAVYAEVNRRLKAGITVTSPYGDRAGAASFTYKVIRPMIYHTRVPADASMGDAHVFYQLVFSDPTAGQEDEYNRWYDEEHAPDVLAAPGFVEAQRLVLSETQLNEKERPAKYLVMFKIVADDFDRVKTASASLRSSPSHHAASPAMGQNSGYTYEAMGPAVDGDQVRADRAKKKPASEK